MIEWKNGCTLVFDCVSETSLLSEGFLCSTHLFVDKISLCRYFGSVLKDETLYHGGLWWENA